MKQTPTPVIIHSSKYDGSFHYEYFGELVESIIDKELGRIWKCLIRQDSLIQSYRGILEAKSDTTAYFFEQQWFNLLIPKIPIGRRQMTAYANVSTPTHMRGGMGKVGYVLDWVDLDLDLIQLQTGDVLIDDEDEFLEHQVSMEYPQWLIEASQSGLNRLMALDFTNHGFLFGK
jgi:protein associated with RNAse G/E